MTVDLDERLRADLPRLADHLLDAGRAVRDDIEHPDRTDRSGPSATRSGQWWLRGVAAAALVLVVGAVSVTAARRDGVAIAGDDEVTSILDGTTQSDVSAASEPGGDTPVFTRTSEPMWVSISIYSGRPDPAFTPTRAEEALLVELLSRLQPPDGETAPPPYLGFRGFVITGLEPAGEVGGRFRIEVWGTAVTISGYDVATSADRGAVSRSDPAGELFDALLDMTEAHVDELDPDGHSGPELVEALRDGAPR